METPDTEGEPKRFITIPKGYFDDIDLKIEVPECPYCEIAREMKPTPDTEVCEICHGFGNNGADDAQCLNCGGSGKGENTPDTEFDSDKEVVGSDCLCVLGSKKHNPECEYATPDTEIEDILDRLDGCVVMERDVDLQYAILDHKKAEPIIQSLLSSRDTYWKERVEETRTALLFVGEKVLKEMSEIYAVDIKYADKKQWLEPSEFERIFLHRFNEAGLKALDTLLDNLK